MFVEDKNIIWLDLFPFLTYQKRVKLLNIFPKDKDIRKLFLSEPKVKEIVTEQEFIKMSNLLEEDKLDRIIERNLNEAIEMVTINDDRYPKLLKEISTPPLCLYCKGNLQLLNTLCVGVVGSRKITDYGVIVTKQYSKALAIAGVTVVSGMANGVDTVAHKTVLENNGATIAVLAGGFHYIYPANNYALSKKLAENNLLITENNPDIQPLTYYFPIRNRIIAGLSKAVLITEAGLKSGSLHTKDYALEYNRDIFAVPGQINSPMSEGTNRIIKEFQSSITLNPEDLLQSLGIKNEKIEKKVVNQLDFNSQLVLDYIKFEKKTFQQIADYTKLPIQQLNSLLTELEMDGIIEKLANNSYIMC